MQLHIPVLLYFTKIVFFLLIIVFLHSDINEYDNNNPRHCPANNKIL